MLDKIRVALVCGGPSRERGISLNSARTVLDHLGVCDDVEILPLYVDLHKRFHCITPGQLCCNTPSDFDFKLPDLGLSSEQLRDYLQSVDIVFPVLHGAFGEDGELQSMLERWGVPFVGSDSRAAAQMFNKYAMQGFLKKIGYKAIHHTLLCSLGQSGLDEKVQHFWCNHVVKKAVVKPNSGGSSIGVHVVHDLQSAQRQIAALHDSGYDQVLVEPFIAGQEFTIIVIQDHQTQQPVALLPTRIEVLDDMDGIFSYRRKYLPTNNTTWHCPAFTDKPDLHHRICREAEDFFVRLGCQDFVRFDGWVMDNGDVLWTDFNPISGMEQNSFLFLQASRIGMTHQHILRYVLHNALMRTQKVLPLGVEISPPVGGTPMRVVCGGDSAERHVSLMSGMNVFLQLMYTGTYNTKLYIVQGDGVWRVPYAFALFHTVEEVCGQCLRCEEILDHLECDMMDRRARLRLQELDMCATQTIDRPHWMTIGDFMRDTAQQKEAVFIALHGGLGEDGRIQAMFEEHHIPFNGSSSAVCALLMDKKRTGDAVNAVGVPGVYSLPKCLYRVEDLQESCWAEITHHLQCSHVIAKPNGDGCSAGVVVLCGPGDLMRYRQLLMADDESVPANTFYQQPEEVVLPVVIGDIIFEPFVFCDAFIVNGGDIKRKTHEGWVEMTMGIIQKGSDLYALNPSVTLSEGAVLSLEEKFQGGTGVNITPPPDFIMSPADIVHVRRSMERVAEHLGVRGYTRVDFFYNTRDQRICIIEFNALPGLTPSTVLYHQGVAENTPLHPKALLQHIAGRY